MRKVLVIGKFQSKSGKFGFVIPEDREYWGGDLFVNKDNFNGAKDGDTVKAKPLIRTKGKKQEVKISEVVTGKKQFKGREILKVIEGIYSGGNGDFGFIDIEGEKSGYFVYGKKKNGAVDGDKVKAEVIMYNGKPEAKVIEILKNEKELIEGVYKDNEKFGFVIPNDKSGDIFIPGGKKGEAKDGDKVEAMIIKRGSKKPEGLIKRVL